ncbi:MAG TPA: mechanosensitive ion channel domain-containing protein [Streptosporangiaceae bacterium]|nr:mechanosensitive ion channel domain-containing protein [Streptosporangiaceae bacterium]
MRSDERTYDLHELSMQMARVKEKTRPWKESIALVLAIGAAVVSHNATQIFKTVAQQTISQLPTIIAYALAVVFCVLAIIAVLGISGKTQNFLRPRLGSAHAAIVRYAILLVGVIITLVLTLQLCRVPVGQLVVGGALTSVLLGIAAQQSLSNIFAGMVLLLSRPFHVGDHIQLRAGALGGELKGTVTEIGITYIRLDTGDSVMSVPNSQVLAAAVGPVPLESGEPEPASPPAPEAENPATRPPGTGAHV